MMGFLNPQTAGAAASSSMWTGAAATGLDAVGSIIQGLGAQQQYNYQAAIARNNAEITRRNAEAELAAGSYEESASKLRYGQLGSAQKAAQAANGIDVAVGSAPAVRDATANIGAMDAAVIHYNTARAAGGLYQQANDLDAQAQIDKMAGRNAVKVGAVKAGTTILSGASALSSKWAAYKKSGAK